MVEIIKAYPALLSPSDIVVGTNDSLYNPKTAFPEMGNAVRVNVDDQSV